MFKKVKAKIKYLHRPTHTHAHTIHSFHSFKQVKLPTLEKIRLEPFNDANSLRELIADMQDLEENLKKNMAVVLDGKRDGKVGKHMDDEEWEEEMERLMVMMEEKDGVKKGEY